MNKLIKIICMSMLMVGFNGFANNSKSTLLLTQGKGSYVIDFLNEGEVTAMQFDISVNGLEFNKLSLNSCVSGLAETHTGDCAIQANGKLRVLIYSDTMSVLESGNLGSFTLNLKRISQKLSISIDEVLMGTAEGKKVDTDVVIDIKHPAAARLK